MVTRREALEELARRALQRNLTKYKRFMYKRYMHAPHLEVIDRTLEQVTRYVETGGAEGIGRVAFEMPPRHGKTLTISRFYPSWHLGRNPDHRIMLVSYGHSLTIKNSRIARNLVKAPRYQAAFPGIYVAEGSASAEAWDIADHDGGVDAMGIGGAATGKGAHILIPDDPHKNRQEAESRIYRERVWDSYTDDLYTRLEPGGAIIVVHTRWHKDDLIGRIKKMLNNDPEADEWLIVRLPAICDSDDDLLGREIGAPLWPARYPLPVLRSIERTIGRYGWSSEYQQRPRPREGGSFKGKFIDDNRKAQAPDLVRIVIGVDPSGSSSGDEVGIVAAGKGLDGHGYILSDFSLQASPLEWARAAVHGYRQHLADVIVGERNYGGDMVAATIRTVDDSVNYRDVVATRGKVLRAEPIAAKYEQGLIHHVGRFPELEEEMTEWKPGGDSPNRMDALVWALTELMIEPPNWVFDHFSDENVTDYAAYRADHDVYWGIHDGYVYGAGPGSDSYNPRAVALVQHLDDGTLCVFDEYIAAQQQPAQTIEALSAREYSHPRLAMTYKGPVELRRQLSEARITNGSTKHNIEDGVNVLRRMIGTTAGNRQLFIHPRCENLIRQLQQYRYNPSGATYQEDCELVNALRAIIWNFK